MIFRHCTMSQLSTPISDGVGSLTYLYLSPRPLPVSSFPISRHFTTSLRKSALFFPVTFALSQTPAA